MPIPPCSAGGGALSSAMLAPRPECSIGPKPRLIGWERELAYFTPDPELLRAQASHAQAAHRRAAIEALIDRAIEALDALDGDPDLEEEHDCCSAADDNPVSFLCRQNMNDHRPGTLEDAEPDADGEPDDEDLGAGEDEPVFHAVASPAATAWQHRNGSPPGGYDWSGPKVGVFIPDANVGGSR